MPVTEELATLIAERLKKERFASFLTLICSVAGHVKKWIARNVRDKSKRSPANRRCCCASLKNRKIKKETQS